MFSECGKANASISSVALPLSATPKTIKRGNKIGIYLCKRTLVKITDMAYLRLLRVRTDQCKYHTLAFTPDRNPKRALFGKAFVRRAISRDCSRKTQGEQYAFHFFKVRQLLDENILGCRAYYVPGRNGSIDEPMIASKARMFLNNTSRTSLQIGTGSQNYKYKKYVISCLHNAGIAITSVIKQTRRFYV